MIKRGWEHIPEEVVNSLTESNKVYAAWNQRESEADITMVDMGHPFAERYRKLRRYYDSLAICSDSRTRFIAFKDYTESAEYSAPRLVVANAYNASNGFRCNLSSSEATKLLETAASKGWPGAGIEPGAVCIRTPSPITDTELLTSISSDEKSEIGCVVTKRFKTTREALRCLALIERVMQSCLLPRRTYEDDTVTRRPIPLADRKLVSGHVDYVTVTSTEILIPKIPFGSEATLMVERTINALSLLARRGYPVDRIRAWGNRFMKKSYLKSLEVEQNRLLRGKVIEI